MGSHAFFLRSQDSTPELHECLARADLNGAPIPVAERALLDFVALVTQHAYKTTDADVEKLRIHGWKEVQIAEAVYVTALFAFFNRVADAFGLEDPNYFQSPEGNGVPPTTHSDKKD